MNKHSYRVVFNKARGQLMAVAECAMAQGKTASGEATRLVAASLGLALACTVPSYAGPTGGSVAAGSANINQVGSLTTVNQQSQRAIVNWQSFSLNKGETVNFNTPNANSATLNRVTGNLPSSINGVVNSNGSVYLINQNGVIVGKDGVVNAGGGFTVSTRDVDNTKFMQNGNLVYTTDANVGAAIDINGRLNAAAININGSAINVTGVLKATGVQSNPDGSISLIASNTTSVGASAQLIAKNLDGSGGNVKVWADGHTDFYGSIDASATHGNGGFVEVSGKQTLNFQGKVDTRALDPATGKTGTLLLDPTDITIQTLGVTSTTNAAGTITGVGALSILTVTDLVTALGTTNVTVDTNSPDVSFGVITVASPITWATGNSLTLKANNNILLNAAITGTGPGAGITLTAGVAGNITFGAAGSLKTEGGAVTLSANSITGVGATSTVSTQPASGNAGAISFTATSGINGLGAVNASGATPNQGAAVIFTGNVDSIAAGSDLTVSGKSVSFSAPVGANLAFDGISVQAQQITINGGMMKSNGGQLYAPSPGGTASAATLSLGGNTSFVMSGGAVTSATPVGDIYFNTTVNANGNAASFNAAPATVGAVSLASNVITTQPANTWASVSVANAGSVDLVNANTITVGPVTASNLRVQALSGDVNLGGNIVTSGTGGATDPSIASGGAGVAGSISAPPTASVSLAASGSAGRFVNQGPGTGFTITTNGAGARWLVYSFSPGSDTRGSALTAAYDFKQYGTSYTKDSIGNLFGTDGHNAGPGNGVIYSMAPPYALESVIGTATKPYDGTAVAPTSGIGVVGLMGYDGDTAVGTLGTILSASFDTPAVGNGKSVAVNVSPATLSSIYNVSGTKIRPVYGYAGVTVTQNVPGQITGAVPSAPTAAPTPAPTAAPTPTSAPSPAPTSAPTPTPTSAPTPSPTTAPFEAPSPAKPVVSEVVLPQSNCTSSSSGQPDMELSASATGGKGYAFSVHKYLGANVYERPALHQERWQDCGPRQVLLARATTVPVVDVAPVRLPPPAQVAAAPQVVPAARPVPSPQPPPLPLAPVQEVPVATKTLAGELLFGFGRYKLKDIKPGGRELLDKLVPEINQTSLQRIRIVGHADRIGSAKFNLLLSQRRAETVREYLKQQGVATTLQAQGRGLSEPLVACKGEHGQHLIDCLQPNRRVVVEGYIGK